MSSYPANFISKGNPIVKLEIRVAILQNLTFDYNRALAPAEMIFLVFVCFVLLNTARPCRLTFCRVFLRSGDEFVDKLQNRDRLYTSFLSKLVLRQFWGKYSTFSC